MILDARTLGKLNLGKLEEALLAAISEQLTSCKEEPDVASELVDIHNTLVGYVAASRTTTEALESLRGRVERIIDTLQTKEEED